MWSGDFTGPSCHLPYTAQDVAEPPVALPILPDPETIPDLPADYPRSDEFGP